MAAGTLIDPYWGNKALLRTQYLGALIRSYRICVNSVNPTGLSLLMDDSTAYNSFLSGCWNWAEQHGWLHIQESSYALEGTLYGRLNSSFGYMLSGIVTVPHDSDRALEALPVINLTTYWADKLELPASIDIDLQLCWNVGASRVETLRSLLFHGNSFMPSLPVNPKDIKTRILTPVIEVKPATRKLYKSL